MASIVWDETLWLPENTSWADLVSKDGVQYPQREEFYYTIFIGILMLAFRICMESFVFLPIGYATGYVRTPLIPRIASHLCGGFAGKTKFKRVAECAWRFFFYSFAWTMGLYVLRDQPQFSSVVECWKEWPRHHVPNSIWWYYMIEAGFYWGLLFSQLFFDIRRADFYEMTAHHSITIGLLWISWSMNMVRVGTLVLFSHDAADILLEMGKLLRYGRWQKTLEGVFVVFIITWTATRLVFYPFWVVWSVVVDGPAHIQDSYQWINLLQRPIIPRVLMFMLCSLIFLHIVWTIVILRIAHKTLTTPEGVDDIREESDDDTEEEQAEQDKKRD